MKVFSLFNFIYRGPHLDNEGRIDPRVRFIIPLQYNEAGLAVYLTFPYGAEPEEIIELQVDPKTLWTD